MKTLILLTVMTIGVSAQAKILCSKQMNNLGNIGHVLLESFEWNNVFYGYKLSFGGLRSNSYEANYGFESFGTKNGCYWKRLGKVCTFTQEATRNYSQSMPGEIQIEDWSNDYQNPIPSPFLSSFVLSADFSRLPFVGKFASIAFSQKDCKFTE